MEVQASKPELWARNAEKNITKIGIRLLEGEETVVILIL
jgi:hypothetical protein